MQYWTAGRVIGLMVVGAVLLLLTNIATQEYGLWRGKQVVREGADAMNAAIDAANADAAVMAEAMADAAAADAAMVDAAAAAAE